MIYASYARNDYADMCTVFTSECAEQQSKVDCKYIDLRLPQAAPSAVPPLAHRRHRAGNGRLPAADGPTSSCS